MPPELDGTAEINSTYPHGLPGAGPVVVRTEEALIVLFVLLLWVAAIALFFNRWGKIRMLEPYQPKFQQQHRQSCAIVDPNPIQHRTYSKFNIHCAEHPVVHPSVCTSGSRPRQNSVFVGSSTSLLPGQETPRRTKSAFDLQSLVLAECTVLDDSEEPEPDTLRTLRPPSESSKLLQHDRRTSVYQFERKDPPSKSFQRERGMSICQSDRADAIVRPMQRDRGMSVCQYEKMGVLPRAVLKDRGMSVCHFDRTDVLARPLQRDRGSSICHFDRMDVLARPSACLGKSLLRERRVSVCNFMEREEEIARGPFRDRRVSVSNLDRSDGPVKTMLKDQKGFCNSEKIESTSAKCLQRERNNTICHYDRPSCSKTPDVVLGYKATCV